MDPNSTNVVECETSMKKDSRKHVWDSGLLMVFLELCLNEVNKGNRPSGSFNKLGWTNLEKNMLEKTGKAFDKRQLKNKWDVMKKEWKLYDRLMRLETGIGGTRYLLDASPEWWDEKIKVDKDFAKFRGKILDVYETHYAPLFRDTVATGDQTISPLQFQNGNSSNDVQLEENIEGRGDSDEVSDDEPLFPTFPEKENKRQKPNSRSSKSKTSCFEEKLDVVLEDLSSRCTQTFPPTNLSPTIPNCMNIVVSFPGFNEGSRNYSKALRFFIKKDNREAFMFPTTNEGKMEFLKLLLEE